MTYNADVTVAVEIGFGDSVYETSPTFVDVVGDVREFSVVRGRDSVLDQVNPGRAYVTLSNADGDYSSWNTQGSYAGDVNVLTPIRITAEHDSTTYGLFRGYVVAWPPTWPAGGKDAVVRLECVDGFHLLAMVELAMTRQSELSGSRVGHLLGLAGWPAGWRTLDAGRKNVAALSAEFNTVLSELRRVALVEDGLFYIDGSGIARFKDGVTRIEDDSIAATFSDDGSDLGYREVAPAFDPDQLWNSATVTRTNGTAQTSTASSSITQYGERNLHLSETLHVADGEALAFADWMTTLYATPRTRIPQVTVIPEEDPADLWPVCLGLDFWEKVNVERTDVSGDPLDVDCYVEGITHTVTMTGGRSWTTSFQLSADLPYSDWWILGTSELGVNTRLAY